MLTTHSSLSHLASEAFGLSTVDGDGAVVVRLRGEYDRSTVEALEELLRLARALESRDVVVHLAEVEFLDAATVAVFVRERARLALQARRLLLRSPTPWVHTILNLCNVESMIESEPVRDASVGHALTV